MNWTSNENRAKTRDPMYLVLATTSSALAAPFAFLATTTTGTLLISTRTRMNAGPAIVGVRDSVGLVFDRIDHGAYTRESRVRVAA